MTSLLTNLNAIRIIQNIKRTEIQLIMTERRISSGLRVASAEDNPALWSISQDIIGKKKYWEGVEDGLKFASAVIYMAQKAAERVVENLSDLKAAIIAYSSTGSDEAKSVLKDNVQKIVDRNDLFLRSSEINSGYLLTKTTAMQVEGQANNAAGTLVDYVFCLDNSGSMSSHLNSMRDNLKAFAEARRSAGEDARFSFVTYSDVGASEPLVSSAFYTDPNEFELQLATIPTLYGGDIPESGLEGLQLLRMQSFRHSASRQVIMITDATVHEMGDGSGSINTVTSTVADLLADGIHVTIAGPSPPDPRLQAISTGTGGSYHSINDPTFFTGSFGLPPKPPEAESNFRILQSPEGGTINIHHRSLLAKDTGLNNINLDVPQQALLAVNSALEIATSHASYLGASHARIVSSANFADEMQSVHQSSIGILVDANLEEESAKLQALKVQMSISSQSLALANSQPNILNSLFIVQ